MLHKLTESELKELTMKSGNLDDMPSDLIEAQGQFEIEDRVQGIGYEN